jgi:hypothetical protein
MYVTEHNSPYYSKLLLTLSALLLAVAHCLFFQYLDGRILSPGIGLPTTKTTTIPQGYVTALSFLLITAFRAALVASVGICYTQYLWATLRTKVLKVGSFTLVVHQPRIQNVNNV